METDGRMSFVTALAERGLAMLSFDGHILKLAYRPSADHRTEQGKRLDFNELAQYAQRLLVSQPAASRMFPGLERIQVIRLR